jgi:two-component system response regulator
MSEDDVVEILLVEDDQKDVRLALHALRAGNLVNRIDVARDGEEALDYLFHRGIHSELSTNCRPKLILLDLKLPKVDGIQVLREIKTDPRTRAIPVTVLTSSREERDLAECYRLGVNSYIQKPVDFDQFRETIKTLGLYWMVVNQMPPPVSFASNCRVTANWVPCP